MRYIRTADMSAIEETEKTEETASAPREAELPKRVTPLFNRELSWLEFNRRVLAEAENAEVPLLERLKFAAIAASNLDEFFMIRVGGIRDLLEAGIFEASADGLTPRQQLDGIRGRVRELMHDLSHCVNREILPALRNEGIQLERLRSLGKNDLQYVKKKFETSIAPILTPLAFDPGHPFPFLSNQTLNIAVVLATSQGAEHTAFIRVPPLLPRFVPLPGDGRYLPLEELIASDVGMLFPGLTVERITPFRVLRDADISIREEEVTDLLKTVETELRKRDRQDVVWIEIGEDADSELVGLLSDATGLPREDILPVRGLLGVGDLMEIYANTRKSRLRDPAFNPRIPPRLAAGDDIFTVIRSGDLLLHRPYESFAAVVEFVQTAATDPEVVAIKQTLYRTDEGSPVVEALVSAALAGKQVTALIELQARFDEMKNIAWARRLENAGVQVVYGLVGIKTHCKLCLVVRREEGTLRRYVHLSTGNYNSRTAKLYTDLDLFTCDPNMCEDAAQLMNLLTGYSLASAQEIFERHVPDMQWKELVVAPLDYHDWVLHRIASEAANAREGRPAHIVAKLNSLVDASVIEAMYEASRAGVRIDLLVRGICCLVPGLPRTSENIRVTSVIDRYLEHSRIFVFENGGDPLVYVSSGDWMPRNFFRRIELTYPVKDPMLSKRIREEIIAVSLSDNVKAWELHSDGTYHRVLAQGPPLRSQERFIELTRRNSVRIGPYDEIVGQPLSLRKKGRKRRKRTDARRGDGGEAVPR